MAQYAKEIGLLWAFCVSCMLINAADERGRRLFLGQGLHLTGSSNVIFGMNSGSSGSSFMNIHPIGVSSTNNNNANTLSLDYFQGCERYTEYNELIDLQNNLECHSIETVFYKLRVLHEQSPHHGPGCMHDVIGKLTTYFSRHRDNFMGCTCNGHVVYHPERYHNPLLTCKNRNSYFDDVYTHLFKNVNHGPCIPHYRALIHLDSLQAHLENYLDCQWEIINHYATIIDANQMSCSCFYEPMNAHITPVHTLSTTMSLTTSENKPMSEHTTPHSTNSTSVATSPTSTFTVSVPHTCTKLGAISTLGHGIKQTNPGAGNCHPETFDHMAPEALVMNMCNVTGLSETWTRGKDVMSVCERIPLYTPIATFFDGKYSSQGGLAGIFVGCLQDGFKMIVQECDKNITVMHVVTGGHFHLDPLNYSIIM